MKYVITLCSGMDGIDGCVLPGPLSCSLSYTEFIRVTSTISHISHTVVDLKIKIIESLCVEHGWLY